MEEQTTYVIARYNEDISWSDECSKKVVIQKDKDVLNFGREPFSFLWYIIENYEKLKGGYWFMQGDPSDHYPFQSKKYTCYRDHCPQHAGLPFDKITRVMKLPREWEFYAGGQFRTNASDIRRRPKVFYEQIYKLMSADEKLAWVMERVWFILFPQKGLDIKW
jgi:hypothetical protein